MLGSFFNQNLAYRDDAHFRDLVLFYEYFHGDTARGVGASHQTGWTGVVAELIQSLNLRSLSRSNKEEEQVVIDNSSLALTSSPGNI